MTNLSELLEARTKANEEAMAEVFRLRSMLEAAEQALAPLVAIADAYDANELDDEARKHWGKEPNVLTNLNPRSALNCTLAGEVRNYST